MIWVALLDLVCLFIGSVLGVVMRLGPEETATYVYLHIDGWLLLFGSVILANYLAGSYRIQHRFSRFNLIVTWLFSILFACLILSITSFAWFSFMVGRGVLFLSLFFYSIMSLFFKLLICRSLFRSEALLCRTVVLGCGKEAQAMRKELENRFVLPAHKVVAYIDLEDDKTRGTGDFSMLDGVAVVQVKRKSLEDVIRSLSVGLIVIALEGKEKPARLYPVLRRLRFEGIEVITPLNVFEIYGGRTPLDLIDENYLMQASMESKLPGAQRIKRASDFLLAVVAFVIFLFPSLLIALAIKLCGPRLPVFYTQPRLGRFGVPFRIVKFRTMRVDAEDETGPVWSGNDDSRITVVGRFLRRFRLDEIPQFLNILNGDMSLVGPRPERPEIVSELEKHIPFYSERMHVMPGMTGWAQIRYPYGNSRKDAARKLEYDLYYMKHLTFSLDLQIVLSTLRIVLFGGDRKSVV